MSGGGCDFARGGIVGREAEGTCGRLVGDAWRMTSRALWWWGWLRGWWAVDGAGAVGAPLALSFRAAGEELTSTADAETFLDSLRS